MIVGFVLILSIVGISLATALYSNFLPYFSLLSDIKNYNMAYYGANTAIERSLSVLRYQEAGFQGTGGWNRVGGPLADSPVSDQGGFGYYNTNNTTLQRTIISRPDSQIMPGTGKGNTDSYLLSGLSNDWNKLDYRKSQQIPLRVDGTSSSGAYVADTIRTSFTGKDIKLYLQLIPFVKDKFDIAGGGGLKDDEDGDGDGIDNDVVVDRGRKGFDGTDSFSILPRSLVGSNDPDDPIIPLDRDESIRETSINELSSALPKTPITFGDNFNPLYDSSSSSTSLQSEQEETHLMVGDSSVTSLISGFNFNELLYPLKNLTGQELNFFLTRNLISESNGIYPFLQYRIGFDGDPATLSQPYFIVNAKSQVGEYTVQMNITKSINKDNTLGSFTVVF